MVIPARPDGRRIRHLLDQERAACLPGVLAHHVEAHSPANAHRAHGVLLNETGRIPDFLAPEERQSALGIFLTALHEFGCHTRHLRECANAGRVVVGARLLHVRAPDPPLVRLAASANLGHHAELGGRREEAGFRRDAKAHGARCQSRQELLARGKRDGHAPRLPDAVIGNRRELNGRAVAFRLRVVRHRVRQDACGTALLHRLRKETAEPAIGEHDLAANIGGVERCGSRGADTHEFRFHTARWSGERIAGEHVAVRREREHRCHLASRTDDHDRRVDGFPGRARQRVALDAICEAIGGPSRALLDESRGGKARGNVVDARIESSVSGPPHEPVEIGHGLECALPGVPGTNQREVTLGRPGGRLLLRRYRERE